MGDDTFLDLEGLNDVFPGLEIEVEDCLLFLDVQALGFGCSVRVSRHLGVLVTFYGPWGVGFFYERVERG